MTGTQVSPDTKGAAADDSAGLSLEARLADRTRELDELTRQHAATVEILDIIARSPAGFQPVLDAVVRAAAHHCGADDSSIILREGSMIFVAAHEGPLPSALGSRQRIERSRLPARVILDGQTIHAPDSSALDPVDFAATVALSQEFGVLALIGAPIRHAGEVIGCLLLRRREVGPFAARQITMLESLATQAGIAVANAGLIAETREALEQQTATAEILRAITQSPTDFKPVLEAVAQAAVRFCGATDAIISLRDGDDRIAAAHAGNLGFVAARLPLDRASGSGRAIIDACTIHTPDIDNLDPVEFSETRKFAALNGFRSALAAPLMRGVVAIGSVSLRKPTPDPFKPREIALLETFAAQAVIAIENARLFTELKESLEQQTATAEILKIISRSLTDVRPVLDAVVEAAARFCGAEDVTIALRDGDHWVGAAHVGPIQAVTGERIPLSRETIMGRALIDGCAMHVPDIERLDPAEFGAGRALSARLGLRAMFVAPMMREGIAIGGINLRRATPGPFTARQIELAESLASQAVIAIENVRLFTEQRDSLEQQTATADILRAISQSPTDVQPVLDAVVKAAVRFCGATDAIINLRDGSGAITAAHAGELGAVPGRIYILDRETAFGRAILDGRTWHFPDIESLDPLEFATLRRIGVEFGFRATVSAPLMRGGVAIGAVNLRKSEAGPFTARQVHLLETFAAQAVIAIENVRLFTEQRESLEQQTVTADILRVISQSPTDVRPVLNALVAAARRFCGGEDAVILLREGEEVISSAHDGLIPVIAGRLGPLDRTSAMGRAILDGRTIHHPDIALLDPAEFPKAIALTSDVGVNALIAAPMMSDGIAVGAVMLRRRTSGAFTDRQIKLLETFAAQAVIALQNTRLFTELREALEQQTATSDILHVIAQSPTNVQPVLAAVVKAAARFCGAADALISLRDGATYTTTAHEGSLEWSPGERLPLDRSTARGRAIVDSTTCHFPDVHSLDPEEFTVVRSFATKRGFRAVVAAPMLRDGSAIGCVSLRKLEPGPFTPRQVELLETFAAQAVIAIENVRLFTELRQRTDDLSDALEQQTAMADILTVISRSPTDVQPVLEAIAKAAVRFCGAPDAIVTLREKDETVVRAHEGILTATLGLRRAIGDSGNVGGQAMREKRTLQVADVTTLDPVLYAETTELARQHHWRATAIAPLLRDGEPIGLIILRKPEPGILPSNQIALLETFAAQAVIAIENVRLFTELRDSLERLKAVQANLIHSEKMASLGQLTAGIAHEIKNPLNFVNNFATLSVELLDELKEATGPTLATLDGDRRAELDETMELLTGNLAKIAEHGKRADGIVRSMLSHSRGGTGDWQTTNVNGLVDEALNLAYHGARAQHPGFNVTLERDLAPDTAPIEIVPQDLTRVFLNLFGNGFYATRKRHLAGAGPSYQPSLAVRTRDLGDSVEIRVRDNGTGIPPEVRDRLFQPFFTTKPTGEGTGLGLSISWDIVTQQHGGTITVDSEPGEWTEFTIRLPRRRRSAEGARVG